VPEIMNIEETADGFASLFANSRRENGKENGKGSRKKPRKPGPEYTEVSQLVLNEMQDFSDILNVRLVETTEEWLQVFVYDREKVEAYIEAVNDPEFAQRFVEAPGEEKPFPSYRMEG